MVDNNFKNYVDRMVHFQEKVFPQGDFQKFEEERGEEEHEYLSKRLQESGIHPDKSVCQSCNQKKFYNSKEESFYCPACKQG